MTKPVTGAAANPDLARLGGSVTAAQSKAKAAALAALHRSRIGRRINDPGVTQHPSEVDESAAGGSGAAPCWQEPTP